MKTLLTTVGWAMCLMLGAQTITEGQSALIYSLPKTELVIRVAAERVTETPGEFFQYADRYLAESRIITRKKVYYRLKNIAVTARTVPDKERTFRIIPVKKSITSLVAVNDRGILCGINVAPPDTKPPTEITTTDNLPSIETKRSPLPLNEEYMLAGSTAKMAEGAAKQIYRIRESKMDLLAGDVEYMPSDGTSMKTMIAQMDEQEKQLTALFTGTETVETFSQSIVYAPAEALKDKVLFRFSSSEGVVDADDLSGVPYYIALDYNPVKVEANEKAKKAKEEVFAIVPVTAHIRLYNQEKTFFSHDLVVPQLGTLMPIPLETLGKNGKASVSPETGRLLSVEQGGR